MPDLFVQRTADQVVRALLAQSAPDNTVAVTFYQPGTGVQTVVKKVVICNITGADAAYSIWHNDAGATLTATHLLYLDNTVTAGKTHVIDGDLYVDAGGAVGVRSDVTSALVFSMYGEEVRTQAR